MSVCGKADLAEFTARPQRRVVISTFGAERNGLVDSIEQMLLLQTMLHQTYCGTSRIPEDIVDPLDNGGLYPKSDVAVDRRAAYDAIVAIDVCEPHGSRSKVPRISARDRLSHGIIR